MSSYVAYRPTTAGPLEPYAFVDAPGEAEAARAVSLPQGGALMDCHDVPATDVLRAQYRMQVRDVGRLPPRGRVRAR